MRMRKLGKGQSLVFCVPDEIRVKIIECTRKPQDSTLEVADIVRWAISESMSDLKRNMPLWASQGRRFNKDNKA
jgi:hypothetical protein